VDDQMISRPKNSAVGFVHGENRLRACAHWNYRDDNTIDAGYHGKSNS
jgi:hypothetical protein